MSKYNYTGGFCGDGVKQANEQCDDGNTNDTDSCRNNCLLPVCGDNVINQANEHATMEFK